MFVLCKDEILWFEGILPSMHNGERRMRATRETVDLTPRTGNRFTGASGLTIREVEMLLRTSEKIQKIVNKPNLWGLTKRNLNIINQVAFYNMF